jgi:hypothetical protein
VSGYGLDDRAIRVRSPAVSERIFPLASVSRPALGPTQPSVQRVPGVLSPGLKRCRSVTLTTHPHLVPRSRMSRRYNSSPPSASMACSGAVLASIHNSICFRSISHNHHHRHNSPLWAIVFLGFPDNRIFHGGAVNPTPDPQPGGPGLRIYDHRRQGDPAIPPGTHWVPILVAFYDTHELRWDCSYTPVTTRRWSISAQQYFCY